MPKHATDWKFIVRFVAFYGIIIGGPVWLFWGFNKSLSKVESGEHLSSIRWLPQTASDISFYKCSLYHCGEFRISESDFRNWMQERGLELSTIDEPVSLRRYLQFSRPRSGSNDPWEQLNDTALVSRGLKFHSQSRPDRWSKIAWNAETGIAYYDYNHR